MAEHAVRKRTQAEKADEVAKKKAAKEAFVGGFLTPQMHAFIAFHPEYREVAIARDKELRATIDEELYDRYQQFRYSVIKKRTMMPYDPSNRAVALETTKVGKRTKTKCSVCHQTKGPGKDWYYDFARHAQTHERNPGQMILCFVRDCDLGQIARNDATTVDEHIARHGHYAHLEGRAKSLVWDLDGKVFNKAHMPIETAHHLMHHQLANLHAARDKPNSEPSAALSKVLLKFQGQLPADEDVKALSHDDLLALLKDVRKALHDLEGDFTWDDMGPPEENPDEWGAAEDQEAETKGNETEDNKAVANEAVVNMEE